MWRRAQSTADNLPTNPSAGETARVGGKAASPYKRPSNPESQTVVVTKGFLGQGYKHPGHPAALSLAKGRGSRGRGVCRPVGQVFLILSYRERCKSARDSRNPPPDHPEPKKTRGTKRSKGNPTHPEEAKRH